MANGNCSFALGARTTDTLNSLLRGELSAVETYQQAVAKLGDRVPRQSPGPESPAPAAAE